MVKHISDMRFSRILIDVADELLDLYSSELVNGSSPQTAKLFLQLQRRVEREERNVKQLMALQESSLNTLDQPMTSDYCNPS